MLSSPLSPSLILPLLPLIPPKKTNQKAEVEKIRVNFNWHLIAMTTREFIGDAFESIDTLRTATGTRTCIRLACFFADCLPYWLRLKRSDLQHSLRFFRFIIIFIYYYCVYYWIRIRFQFRFQFRWFFQGACHKNWKLVVVATSIFNLGGLSKFIDFWRRVQQFNCGCGILEW